MKNHLLTTIEKAQAERIKTYKVKEKDKEGKETEKELQRQLEKFQIGDTIDVHQRILEGQKERIQVFSGVVISRKGEGKSNGTFAPFENNFWPTSIPNEPFPCRS